MGARSLRDHRPSVAALNASDTAVAAFQQYAAQASHAVGNIPPWGHRRGIAPGLTRGASTVLCRAARAR